MNVLRIRLSLQEKREVLVTAGQLALVAADGAAQSAISRLAVLVVPDEHRTVVNLLTQKSAYSLYSSE